MNSKIDEYLVLIRAQALRSHRLGSGMTQEELDIVMSRTDEISRGLALKWPPEPGHPKLAKRPSEYDPDGRRHWNTYPFVSQLGDDITIGPRSEDQYAINPTEARNLSAALLAAADYAELPSSHE